MRFYSVELTGLKLSHPYGHGMVTALRTPEATVQVRPAMCTQELSSMKNLVSRFVKDESGATAIEYGLIAAGIAVAIISAVNGLGTKLSSNFVAISNSLK
jgi:pilus assembly protein Flp/PilA